MRLIGSTHTGTLIVEMSAANWQEIQTPIQGQTSLPQTAVQFPHINQKEKGAELYLNDCGMACVAMCIHALTDKRPSVNHLMDHYVQKEHRGHALSFAQLLVPLKAFGLQPIYKRPFLAEDIKEALAANLPCIVLVKYSALPKPLQASNYTRSHFIVISEYDNEAFRFHDPLAENPKWINAIDLHTAMSGFTVGENLPYQGMIING